ncbi:DUF2716 domain-containing protein [Dactylosporangium sp. NPDC051485]|uniref:DUF2716 domain-containing protein n=1 Tax=Dactylosporangium sp. NPDC051485 TaxID=3154846 RepID=UPI003442FF8A
MAAWEELPFDTYDELWSRVPAGPEPSVTFDLSGFFTARVQAEFNAAERAVNDLAQLAFVRLLPPQRPLLVLNREHASFRFWPHRSTEPLDRLVVPNGDHYVVGTEDFSMGTAGHPWEQTLRVWGEPLLGVLAPMLSWLPRRG